jgi:NAD(P)-dependent dehydrogenase (short-subunit alcohol dehydrogenase family)
LENGANVSLHYNTNINSVKEINKKYPNTSLIVKADTKSELEIKQLFTNIIKKFGRVDILILNHGIFVNEDTPLMFMELEQWKNTLDVNLTGFFLFSKEFMLQLYNSESKERANIVMVIFFFNIKKKVGSTSGKFGEFGHSDYSSSKSAIMYGFLKTLKNEIVKIIPQSRVNVVAPGWVRT